MSGRHSLHELERRTPARLVVAATVRSRAEFQSGNENAAAAEPSTPLAHDLTVAATRDRAERELGAPGAVSRRTALGRLGAGALMALGAWPGMLRADGQGGGQFRFIAVNDTHCMSAECEGYLDGLVRQMKTESADFCIHAGDVTEKGEKKYLGMAKDVFSGLRRPMYPVIGNHDYIGANDRRYYSQTFPLRMNYYFVHEGWQFVGLDSSEGLKYENTEVQSATFQWLDDYLWRLSKRKPTVIFTHFPMGVGVNYRPRNADALLERFLDFNLQAVFCGHFHGFTERFDCAVTLTTNRCCALKRGNHDGTTQKGYFVCETKEGKVERRFVQYKPTAT